MKKPQELDQSNTEIAVFSPSTVGMSPLRSASNNGSDAAPQPIVNRGDTAKTAWTGGQGTSSKEVASSKLKEENRIPMAKKLIFSAPTVATLPFVAMWGLHGNKNYQAFGASLSMIALFTALARSFDVVSDPVMSYWTDSASCDKLPEWLRGRRKPFMFFGCFFYSGFLYLLLNPPYAKETSLSVWFGVTYTCYFLCNTLTTIPYDALGPELSEDSNERTGLFFVSNLFDGVGTLVALGLPIVMTKFSADYTDRNAVICKKTLDKATKCLREFRSCGSFLESGTKNDAYQVNSTLSTLFANLTNTVLNLDDADRKCITWTRSHQWQDMVLGTTTSSIEQNNEFCNCIGTCGDACDVANKRTGFMLVGIIFAIWFVVAMVVAVCRISEREPLGTRPKAPPIIPSMRGALNNRLFTILLPAWLCDAFVVALFQSLVPYYVEAIVAPAYQTKENNNRDCYRSSPSYDGGKWIGDAGRSESSSYDRLCDTDTVTAITGLLALVTAIIFLPIWNFIVSKVGKVKTWFLWSLTMAASNILFLFIWKGGVYFLFVAGAINGAPLGAKFLADAILSDIIDYDEYLTGMRSEATYFMFKSFLPKIVQIPASAVPIALLGVFDYRAPEGGKPQDQPDKVSHYIKFVFGIGFLVSCSAYFLKTRYPLRQELVGKLAEALQEHKRGKWARDPMSEKWYKPMSVTSDDEQEAFWLFNHFSVDSLNTAFIKLPQHLRQDDFEERFRLGCIHLATTMNYQFIGAVCFLLLGIIGSGASMTLLSDENWQFVPTLFVVCIGIGIASTGFCALRLNASNHLRAFSYKSQSSPETFQLRVQRLLEHQDEIARLGSTTVEEKAPLVEIQDGTMSQNGASTPGAMETPKAVPETPSAAAPSDLAQNSSSGTAEDAQPEPPPQKKEAPAFEPIAPAPPHAVFDAVPGVPESQPTPEPASPTSRPTSPTSVKPLAATGHVKPDELQSEESV